MTMETIKTEDFHALNIIGDIHGQYKTLKALLRKMPKGIPVSLGDMVDRGPKSRKVLEFFQKQGYALMGNHEHLMLDWLLETERYNNPPDHWALNCGGTETIQSFFSKDDPRVAPNGEILVSFDEIVQQIGIDTIKWMACLPKYLCFEDSFGKLFLSHAPLNPVLGLEKAIQALGYPIDSKRFKDSILWNSGNPRKLEGVYLQVYGHLARKKVAWHPGGDIPQFAVGIDTSKAKVLTGIHWPTMEIYQQKWVD